MVISASLFIDVGSGLVYIVTDGNKEACMKPYQKPSGSRDLCEHGRMTLAHGEATGHHHTVYADAETETLPRADFFEEPDGRRVLLALAPCQLRHQEHGTLVIDPDKPQQMRQGDVLLTPIGHGAWTVTRQTEYVRQERRMVMD